MSPSTARWPSAAAWRVQAAQPPCSLWCGTGTEKILEVKCWCTCSMTACWSMAKRGSGGACTVTVHPLQTLSWCCIEWRWRMLECTGAGWQSGSYTVTQASGSTKHQTSHSMWCSGCCLQVTSGSSAMARGQENLLSPLLCFPTQLCFASFQAENNLQIPVRKWLRHFSQQ